MKKLMLFVAGAISLIAFAGPSAASAAEFVRYGEPLEEPAAETFTGSFSLSTSTGGHEMGVRCDEVTAVMEIESAAAEITQFGSGDCQGTGEFATCSVAGGKASIFGLPWLVSIVSGPSLQIGSFYWSVDFAEGCQFGEVPVAGWYLKTNVPLQLGAGGSMDKLSFAGAVETPLGPATLGGALIADNPGTFSVE